MSRPIRKCLSMLKHRAKQAYEFSPNSYTYAALHSALETNDTVYDKFLIEKTLPQGHHECG